MTTPKDCGENEWIRILLDEEQDAETVSRVQRELESDFEAGLRYREVKSLVDDVEEYYRSEGDVYSKEYDLTHEQKEQLYAQITSVFNTKKRNSPTALFPQLKFSLAVIFGTMALAASIPFFEWVEEPKEQVSFSSEGILRVYEPPMVPYLPPRVEDVVSIPEVVFDEILLNPRVDHERLSFDTLLWERAEIDFGQPALDLPEFNFEKSIIDLMDTDVAPIPTRQFAPKYPAEAKLSRLSGEVLVEFVVDEKGFVRKPKIVSSSNMVFEMPVINAVRHWEFNPGEKDGRVVQVRMRMPFLFNSTTR